MGSNDLRYLQDTLEDCDTEFEELERSEEWFVTKCRDRIANAMLIVKELMNNEDTRSRH